MWTVILCVSSVALSSLSLAVALFAVQRAKAGAESLPGKLRSLPSRVESLEDSLAETQLALAEVANRVKMQKVRNAANHVKRETGEPDAASDPEAWRAWKNKQLRGG